MRNHKKKTGDARSRVKVQGPPWEGKVREESRRQCPRPRPSRPSASAGRRTTGSNCYRGIAASHVAILRELLAAYQGRIVCCPHMKRPRQTRGKDENKGLQTAALRGAWKKKPLLVASALPPVPCREHRRGVHF